MSGALPLLILQAAVIIVAARLVGALARRLGQPAVIAEVIAGIVLGPSLLGRVLPLGIIETSHLLGSMAGAGLLLLSQGLARRLDAAHALTVIAVAAGIVASLFKGGDYEEALLLLALLLVLLRARPAFSR